MSLDSEIQDLLRQALPANSNKKPIRAYFNKKTLKGLIVVFLILISFVFGHFFTILNNNPESLFSLESYQSNTKSVKKKIGIREKAILRHSIQKLAQLEQKHPNTIHNELKYKFKYRSYKSLTFETYIAIMGEIKSRLNQSDKSNKSGK